MNNSIIIKGAREHNLKNIDVEIPRDKLVAIPGWRGWGRRSLSEQSQAAYHLKVPSVSCHQRKVLDEGRGGDEGVTFFE